MNIRKQKLSDHKKKKNKKKLTSHHDCSKRTDVFMLSKRWCRPLRMRDSLSAPSVTIILKDSTSDHFFYKIAFQEFFKKKILSS